MISKMSRCAIYYAQLAKLDYIVFALVNEIDSVYILNNGAYSVCNVHSLFNEDLS